MINVKDLPLAIDWQTIADGKKALKELTEERLLEEALELKIISSATRLLDEESGKFLTYRFDHKTEGKDIGLDSFWYDYLLDDILKMKGLR